MQLLKNDGLGIESSDAGFIQVEKPAGATVKAAYLAAATTGFSWATLANGDIRVEGNDVIWSDSAPSSISSNNYWADVTSFVKTKIDYTVPGRIDIQIEEEDTDIVDGPNSGLKDDDVTDSEGKTTFTFSSSFTCA